ncbi:MAG: BspA family leucine-rich repeat surface protein [Bacteroidetes bacterium]|nr:BspA family leucine-rich repeat surface protein [Bacteroidota bacterium]
MLSGSGPFTVTTGTADKLYKVEIHGSFPQIYFNNGGQKDSLKLITQWGDSTWSSFVKSFYGCSRMDITATDTPVLAKVTNLSNMFASCTNLKGSSANWNWHTEGITDMSSMFSSASSFNADISNWNTGSVINMNAMFYIASNFNQNLNSWDVSKVTNMSSMFSSASSFDGNISSWKTDSVTDMSYMFNDASSFNQDLNSWGVSKVTNMSAMFRNASSFNKNIDAWSTGSVTNMNSMFNDASSFNQDLNSWDVSKVTNMSAMFRNASSFNGNISSWSTGAVTNMNFMFYNASNFNQNLGNWNLLSVTSLVSMFSNSGMDCSNYGATLIGWATGGTAPSNITLGAASIKYAAYAQSARDYLATTKSWTISDNGKDVSNCPCEWIGTTDNDWSKSGNWYKGGLPASGDNFKFHSTVVRDLELDQDRTVGVINMINSGKKIVLGNYNLTVTGLSNIGTGYVKTTGTGKLKMNVANGATLLFPVGNSAYNPIEIKNNTGSADVFSIRILDEAYEDGLTGSVLIPPHVKRTWDIDKASANGGSGVDFKFYWNSGEESALLATPTLNHYNSGISAWEIATSGSGSASGTTLTHTGYNGAFSPFAIGGGPVPLPVELIDFQATPDFSNTRVELTWQTAQEVNNSHFEVLRNSDGINWESIGIVQGKGTIYSMSYYQLVDSNPKKLNYYRLRQVDYDGKSELSPIRFVEFPINLYQPFTIYPNPTTGLTKIEGKVGEEYKITDVQGRLVMQGKLEKRILEIDLSGLVSGIYFINIAGQVNKIVKE